MNIKKTNIDNLFLIENSIHKDLRGDFIKTFSNHNLNIKLHKNINIKESFISKNKRNVLRGIHVQVNKTKSYKFVTCLNGKILDVCIDLRKKSKTFLEIYKNKLESKNNTIMIPPGVGHSFFSISNDSLVLYEISKNYDIKDDISIRYNSIDFKWPVKNPKLSVRDKKALKLNEFLLKYS